MLGYALSRADLDSPAGPPVLKTGDIAERLENGYVRIIGRSSRFIKLFGLRVGLDEMENGLRAQGHRAYVSGSDEKLVVFLVDATDPCRAARAARPRLSVARACRGRSCRSNRCRCSRRARSTMRELSRRAASVAIEPADAPSNLAALLQSTLREPALDPRRASSSSAATASRISRSSCSCRVASGRCRKAGSGFRCASCMPSKRRPTPRRPTGSACPATSGRAHPRHPGRRRAAQHPLGHGRRLGAAHHPRRLLPRALPERSAVPRSGRRRRCARC